MGTFLLFETQDAVKVEGTHPIMSERISPSVRKKRTPVRFFDF